MKYYVIAGEKSGDLHGAGLILELKKLDDEAVFMGFGGDAMAQQGLQLTKHYREMAFMGFAEVLKNLRTIFKNLAFCQQDLLAFQPDVLILIDYPGFNLRMAAFAKKHGIRVFYYISPKIWAWNTKRAWKIKANVERMFVIFPFEVGFYKQFDYQVDYVGNPLLDAIAGFQPDPNFLYENQLSSEKKIIALLPGSRRQELEQILPVMLSVVPQFPDEQFVIAGVDDFGADFYEKFIAGLPVKVVFNRTYNLLSVAEAALVTSGTATLETASLGVPQVVCYKTSGFSYSIAKWLIKVPYISLVNLVGEKEIVKELIQNGLTTENLQAELLKIMPSGEKRERQLADYQALKQKLGTAGASQVVAEKMWNYLQKPV
jgi:lipid-A-disaccharide synthase